MGALLVAAGAQAQNLIPNCSFSSLFMLDGWPEVDEAAWSPIDSDDVPNSGSVRIVNSVAGNSKGVESECIPTQELTQYRVGALALWLDAESSATGAVHLRVEFYESASCGPGGLFGAGSGLQHIEADVWKRVETVVTSPAGFASAKVDLWSWKDPGTGNFIAYFDEAELVSLPEPDASLLAIGAVATLACSRLRPGRRSDSQN
jgi:hypothetical protein